MSSKGNRRCFESNLPRWLRSWVLKMKSSYWYRKWEEKTPAVEETFFENSLSMNTTPCKEGRIWVSIIDFAAVAAIRRHAEVCELLRSRLHSVLKPMWRCTIRKGCISVYSTFYLRLSTLSGFLPAAVRFISRPDVGSENGNAKLYC